MRFPAPIAVPLLAAGLAAAAGAGARAASLNVPLNHSVRLPVAGRAASVVVGNSSVADVTVVDSRTLFVTGKSMGSTDVTVVDPLGRTVYRSDVAVFSDSGRPVTVHRGGERAEASCNPRCTGGAPKTGTAGGDDAAKGLAALFGGAPSPAAAAPAGFIPGAGPGVGPAVASAVGGAAPALGRAVSIPLPQ